MIQRREYFGLPHTATRALCYNSHSFVAHGLQSNLLESELSITSSAITRKKLKEVRAIAEERGLFRGARSKVLRGRLPEALVSRAKARTGIKSDTELLEAALATLAVADDYAEWLLTRKGAVSRGVELEF